MRNHVKFFNKIKHIQNKAKGGCLFFAYAFWLWLKKNKLSRENFHVVQVNNSIYAKERINDNTIYLSCGQGKTHPDYHFMWMYNDLLYDCNCDGNPIVSYNLPHNHDIHTIYAASDFILENFFINALKSDEWNSVFDRDSAEEELRKTLKISFKKLRKKYWWDTIWD